MDKQLFAVAKAQILRQSAEKRRPDHGLCNAIDSPDDEHPDIGAGYPHSEVSGDRETKPKRDEALRVYMIPGKAIDDLSQTICEKESTADKPYLGVGDPLCCDELRHDSGKI